MNPSLAWAVGSSNRVNHRTRPLIERWDGTAWTVAPSGHVGAVTELYGVSAPDAAHAWAVGYTNSVGNGKALVERYDGGSWAVVHTPNPGRGPSGLSGVAAIADTDVWSVGYRTRWRNGREEALVEHWNGTQWSIVTTPRPRHPLQAILSSVSAAAANDVWAVGAFEQNAGLGSRPLIEHWNGTGWSIVPSPDPRIGSALVSVEAQASDDVWAVGYTLRNGFEALAEHWDGSRWNILRVSHAGKTPLLRGVTSTPADVYAVGSHQGRRPLVERWDGSSFAPVSTPRSGGHLGRDELSSLATDGTTVWAAGEHDSHGVGSVYRPLVEYVC